MVLEKDRLGDHCGRLLRRWGSVLHRQGEGLEEEISLGGAVAPSR